MPKTILTKIFKEIKISDTVRKDLLKNLQFSKGDQLMIEVEKIWLALTPLCWEILLSKNCPLEDYGFWRNCTKHFKNFESDLFMKQFFDKGRLKDILKTIL